ncbi:MAG: phosphoglucosamine mutase [Firmicutes bacterium]|nr:phosphoglucosamine mutase [Bacillota bacterium]
MGKYFGTDGIRGKYGEKLTPELAFKTGRALAEYFGKGDYFIARDTRVSGPRLERALSCGITDGGGSVVLCGVIPTPAVAYLAKKYKGLCGVMISASHNPPEYNGIKVFDGSGVKLNEEQEGSVEYYVDNPASYNVQAGEGDVGVRDLGFGARKEDAFLIQYPSNQSAYEPRIPNPEPRCSAPEPRITFLASATQEYIDYIVSVADADLSGLKVWLDCGYGAAATVAKEIFVALGADVTIENFRLRGEKINSGCGALYPDYVKNSIAGTDTRLGFSFDGDADRLSVVCDGQIIDGDSVLYNISKNRALKGGVVVGTVLSNLALEKKLAEEGKRLIRTPVGDKYICDLMFKKGYNLGGEQSGHYIVYPEATTGDGILSAIYFCKAVYKDGKFTPPVLLNLCPQKAIAEYAEPSILYRKDMQALIEAYNEKLGQSGRLIVRMSGTEPKVRVMAESEDEALVDETLAAFKGLILGVV